MEGQLALKIMGALLAALDQSDPAILDRMHAVLAQGAGSPIDDIAIDSVAALISARSIRE